MNKQQKAAEQQAELPKPEDPDDRPSCCSNIIILTVLFILVILIFTLGQFGFHDPEDLKTKETPENESPPGIIEVSRWHFATNKTCLKPKCLEISKWLNAKDREGMVSQWRIPEYRKYGDKVIKIIFEKCLEAENRTGRLPSQEARNLVSWSDELVTLAENYPQLGFIKLQYPTANTVRILGQEFKADLPDTQWRIQMVFQYLVENIGANITLDDIHSTAEDVARFGRELASISKTDEVQLLDLNVLQVMMPAVNWSQVLDEALEDYNGTYSPIQVDVEYLEKLGRFLRRKSGTEISNFLLYKSIENFAHFMSKEVRNIFGFEGSKSPEDECMKQTDFMFSGRFYSAGRVQKWTEDELLKEMVEDIQKQIHKSIRNNGWVKRSDYLEDTEIEITTCPGEEAMEALDEKINTSTSYYSAVQAVFESLEKCNRIKYSTANKTLEIPSTFLQPPYFHPQLPSYINYANLGSHVAEEILIQLLYETDTHFESCFENAAFEHLPGDIAMQAYLKKHGRWDQLLELEAFDDVEIFKKSLCAINEGKPRFDCGSSIDKTICNIFDSS